MFVLSKCNAPFARSRLLRATRGEGSASGHPYFSLFDYFRRDIDVNGWSHFPYRQNIVKLESVYGVEELLFILVKYNTVRDDRASHGVSSSLFLSFG